MMIEYLDPVAEVGVKTIPYGLTAKIKGSNAVNIGFLANGFPDSEAFLDELEIAMQNLEPGIETHSYNKGNASVPASDKK